MCRLYPQIAIRESLLHCLSHPTKDFSRPTKVLNYITAPDTVIWSALLASAAVPGILNPVVLMQKLKDGSLVPWNWGSRFKDGSLRVDIPTQALNLYFNGERVV
jgi:predicted acylesterase/phospholipase RssA